METNLQSTALHCLTYRLKGQTQTDTLIASMPEIEQFIDDMTGFSSTNSFNSLLTKFKPQALGMFPSRLEQILKHDAFIERSVFPVQTALNSTKYRMIRSEEPKEHSKVETHKGVKGILPPLVLNTHTTCICSQTGITFAVRLASPLGTGLTLSHPFCQYQNVVEFISKYQRHGKNMEEIETQELAGMLITVGRYKGYIQAKNALIVNSNLSSCSKPLLIRALNYFYHKGPSNGLYPILSLDNLSDPSFALLQHIKICEGEDTTIAVRTLSTAKKTIRARIYTDKNKQQFTQAKADIKSAKHILEGLRKKHGAEVSTAVFENIETQLDGIFFVTEERKKEICQFIYDVFSGDDGAKSIIILLRSIETDAVESDLLTMSMEKEIADWKEGKTEQKKLSLQELIAQQKGKA